MTMVNAVVQGKRGFLFADTAQIDPSTGKVLGFATKIFAGTRFPWAVGVTHCGDPMHMALAIEQLDPPNVTALQRQMPAIIADHQRRAEAAGVTDPMLRLTAVCWDARLGKPRIFGAGDAMEFTDPNEVVELDYIFGSELDLRHFWKDGSPNDPKCFNVEADGVAVMEERRRVPYGAPGIAAGHYVGGEVEMAEITRHGVQLYSLHQWPDRVGEKIAA